MQSQIPPSWPFVAVHRALSLCRHSLELIGEARAMRSLAAQDRRDSPDRRRAHLVAGSSDAQEAPLIDMAWRQLIRSKLRAGRLPPTRCSSSFSATGRQGLCDGCDLPITPGQIEIGARFRDRHALRFHARCFACWYAEAAVSV